MKLRRFAVILVISVLLIFLVGCSTNRVYAPGTLGDLIYGSGTKTETHIISGLEKDEAGRYYKEVSSATSVISLKPYISSAAKITKIMKKNADGYISNISNIGLTSGNNTFIIYYKLGTELERIVIVNIYRRKVLTIMVNSDTGLLMWKEETLL